MRRLALGLACVVCLGVVAGCASTTAEQEVAQQMLSRERTSKSGLTYWMCEPPAGTRDPALVVVVMPTHDLAAVMRQIDAWQPAAARHGAIVLFPRLHCLDRRAWQPDERFEILLAEEPRLEGLAAQTAAVHQVAPRRQAIVGLGRGGYASLLIGLRQPDRYLAVVATSWGFFEGNFSDWAKGVNPRQSVAVVAPSRPDEPATLRHVLAVRWLQNRGFQRVEEWPPVPASLAQTTDDDYSPDQLAAARAGRAWAFCEEVFAASQRTAAAVAIRPGGPSRP